MASFSHIFILYNPNSTGNSKQNALDYKIELRTVMPKETVIEAVPTKYANHAETLARDYAREFRHCLIISSSGDGGYNEVVNGVMQSGSKTAVTGLLPSGNANDHYSTQHRDTALTSTAKYRYRRIDLLKVTGRSAGKPFSRYAHSYASIGIAPYIGRELNKTDLNPINEKWLVFKHFFRAAPARIRVGKSVQSYDHLVFSNINKMSKILHLSNTGKINDGKFEVSSVRTASFLGVLRYASKAATIGIEEERSMKRYSFSCLKKTPIQLDGEVFTLDHNTTVTISSAHKALRCII